MVAQAGVPKRIGEHVVEASKGLLYDIRTGETVSKTTVRLMERMLNRFYMAEFEERVPMVHHYDESRHVLSSGQCTIPIASRADDLVRPTTSRGAKPVWLLFFMPAAEARTLGCKRAG
jgi:hypothetical protein